MEPTCWWFKLFTIDPQCGIINTIIYKVLNCTEDELRLKQKYVMKVNKIHNKTIRIIDALAAQ